MDLRHPVQTLEWALMQALERDLSGVASPLADRMLGASAAGPISCRPRVRDCSVVLFTQTWQALDLGMNCGRDPLEHVEAETVVVTGPAGDACVYVATQLLYRIGQPNRRFFLDVAAQQLRGKGEQRLYDGRDTVDLEAFDIEAAAALARLRAALRHAGGGEGEKLARILMACASELREADAECVGETAADHACVPSRPATGLAGGRTDEAGGVTPVRKEQQAW